MAAIVTKTVISRRKKNDKFLEKSEENLPPLILKQCSWQIYPSSLVYVAFKGPGHLAASFPIR